ncbi:MAG: HupE / UreJ protein [Flavobacteriaceae bacterium]|nr:HupE / UreJ protein [Flavobacteriaceae bacterium]MBK43701.1 HupE / UreJ protein [Flavobacteriaceae bacterium]|tara:strand:- start:938 stop:1525 length:588 start_codon:yes stop_codon:yes gene_type:complete
MFDSFLKFVKLGTDHIVNFNDYDHILFVIIFSIPFMFKDWKRLLVLITLFTLGHTLSLLLGVYDVVDLNINVTSWLIPLTIFFAALYNIFTVGRPIKNRIYLIYSIILFFGFIHGLAYTNTFLGVVSSDENVFISIIEFAIGIEIGQLIIVVAVLILNFIFLSIFRFSNRDWVLVISSIILGLILPLIFKSPLFS